MTDRQPSVLSSAPPAVGSPTGKYVLFASFGLMALFVLWNNEWFFLDPQAPEWVHFLPIKWYLIPHGFGGTVALAFGALQFSTRLRRRHLLLTQNPRQHGLSVEQERYASWSLQH